MALSSDAGVWLAAVASVGVYSFLYQENPVSRFIEYLFIGLAAGYQLVMGARNIQAKVVVPVITGQNLAMVIPLLLGLLLFARFFPKYNFLSRTPVAMMVGLGTGLTLRGVVVADFIGQIRAAIAPVNSVNSLIMVAGTICTLLYFLFTTGTNNPVIAAGSTFGKYIMMVTFGAGFGNATMGRISQLIGRLDLLLGEWLGLYVR